MTIDEAIHVARMEIEGARRGHNDLDPYQLLWICESLLNVIELIKEEVPELNPE